MASSSFVVRWHRSTLSLALHFPALCSGRLIWTGLVKLISGVVSSAGLHGLLSGEGSILTMANNKQVCANFDATSDLPALLRYSDVILCQSQQMALLCSAERGFRRTWF
ncbi:hypothetical protein BKA93DRAFT_812846 [Sparassis latifolia]